MPAAENGDITAIRRSHPEIEELAEEAAAHADEVARSVESRMVAAHQRATLATQAGLASGGTCVLLIVALSALYTVRLRRALLRPLKALTQAARRFGAGQFESAIGQIGQGELQAVAVAFDRMAAELAARERRLVESERMAVIGQLAAGVAHELNNSIGIVRGYLKTMDPTGDTQTLKEELSILDEEAGHCQRIADDLLAYAGVQKLELRNVQMREFLEETMRRLRESDVLTSVDLRAAAEDAELEADPLRLRQVVANLVINAGQASPRGAVVEVSGKRAGSDAYEIIVTDRGLGIADEDKSRIFEPFFSQRRGGTGLGLALCLGVVKAHRGTIAVEDRESGGTTFRVRLPLKSQAEAPGEPA
jgi:signal transduction histidine kinase